MTLHAYTVRSDALGRRILKSLGERFGARREGPLSRRTTYLDTFDWRLHRAGVVLAVRREDGRAWLLWQSALLHNLLSNL